jgi:hypothetical protein
MSSIGNFVAFYLTVYLMKIKGKPKSKTTAFAMRENELLLTSIENIKEQSLSESMAQRIPIP